MASKMSVTSVEKPPNITFSTPGSRSPAGPRGCPAILSSVSSPQAGLGTVGHGDNVNRKERGHRQHHLAVLVQAASPHAEREDEQHFLRFF